MGKNRGTMPGDLIFLGETSTKLITPDSVFERIENMTPTEEGGLRSASSWVELNVGDVNSPPAAAPSYANQLITNTYGIHHALLGREGEREVLLLHNGNMLMEFRGWERKWYPLIGPTTSSEAQVNWDARVSEDSRWPTQFVTTNNGVVIVPQQGRAYFYDGEIVGPLGFTIRPGPPTGLGPDSQRTEIAVSGSDTFYSMNDTGYAHSRIWSLNLHHDQAFGFGRIGTLESIDHIVTLEPSSAGNPLLPSPDDDMGFAGRLLEGEWRAKVAFIDYWGNISPLSGPSNGVTCDRHNAIQIDGAGGYAFCNGRNALFQVAWSVTAGPRHAIGRNLYRTRDLRNSGDTAYYFLPGDAAATGDAFATLPGNRSRFYPDNIPDSWLVSEAPSIDPVPIFRLAAMYGGRLWVANFQGNPGAMRPSLPGLFGTFPAGGTRIPDPTGAEITGLHATSMGLLVFTRTSTFIVTPNNTGDDFRIQTLSSSVGCIAPSSIATMSDGMTVWLTRDGFYGLKDGAPTPLFKMHSEELLRFNRVRMGRSHAISNPESGNYECWVPVDGSRYPNFRCKFDGRSWHWDDYSGSSFQATDSTAMLTNQPMSLACGWSSNVGYVVALDRGPNVLRGRIKTGWISSVGGPERTSVSEVHLWLRETGIRDPSGDTNDNLQIDIRRNYRSEVMDTKYVPMYPDIAETARPAYAYHQIPTDVEKNPEVFGVALPTDDYLMRKRRPFWVRAVIRVPTCECFQLELSSSDKWEIIGMRADFQSRDESNMAGTRLGTPA